VKCESGRDIQKFRGTPEDVVPKLLLLCKTKMNLNWKEIIEKIEETDVVVAPLFDDKTSVFDVPADAKIEISLKKRD